MRDAAEQEKYREAARAAWAAIERQDLIDEHLGDPPPKPKPKRGGRKKMN